MHDAAFRFVADAVKHYGLRPGLVVEIGGRNINGSVRGLFRPPYLSVDVRPGEGVDIVADGSVFLPPAPAICVVCCEVFEHTAAAPQICAQAHRMLDLTGVFIVTAASLSRAPHSAVDGGPVRAGEFYRGVGRPHLEEWLAPFERYAIVEDDEAGDIYALAWK
jgi:hypothetical protein